MYYYIIMVIMIIVTLLEYLRFIRTSNLGTGTSRSIWSKSIDTIMPS